ncbi:hypothetical protein DFH08DRAFT_1046436 [Mycena albidolilacea]|uniref:Uncharacterized protein n=1 Tax=Mycena albidolilacea TaxID=1033008 RepID=A0AAD7ECH1_9AGAR|nr:hypothetical protein DFH08DRAFT_1046436 [Mycena albidolilacea]
MASKTDILKARLVVARAKEQKNASKKAKKSKPDTDEKENEKVGMTRGGRKDAQKDEKEVKAKRNSPAVEWSKEDFHFMTDELLTVVESKPRYRQTFGFEKGIDGPVDTGGEKPAAIQAHVTETLFLAGQDPDDPDPKYTVQNLPELAKVVKNRITALKKLYTDHRKTLDVITKKFPWYLRMHDLMGSSPVVNRSAVAHSGTRVDLDVLDRDGEAHHGPISLDLDDESRISGWNSSSPARPARAHDSDDDSDVPATPAVKVKTEKRPTPLSSVRGLKRKSIHDRIQDLTTQNHTKQIKIAEVREHEKTVRARAKYEAKSNLEMARLAHQEREGERQRAHDMLMLERQMQLEVMRRNVPGPSTGRYGAGAPAYGAPPPGFTLDPSLL